MDAVMLSKLRQTSQAAFAASSFSSWLYPLSKPLRDEITASSARMSTTTFPGQAHLVQVVYVWKMRRVSGVNSNQRSHAAPGS